MSNLMERAALLVDFLGQVMGKNCEVVLQDIKAKKIVAIANGEVSGRKLNSPLTDLALNVVASETWKEQNYQLNYDGMTLDGKVLRSSTFFLKEKNQLVGMLCINIDTSRYQELSNEILALGGISTLLENPTHTKSSNKQNPNSSMPSEVFSASKNDVVQNTITQCLAGKGNIPVSRLTQSEKMEIVKVLNEKGVFLLKGAISDVAKHLECSDASIYRYLSKLQKN